MWYCSSTAAVSACASASRKGPLGSARSGNVVERKEASGCEKRVFTSGAFSTGWWEGGRRYWLAFGSKDDGERTDLESVVENEYDYAVHVKGDVCCVRRTVNMGRVERVRTGLRVPHFRQGRGRECKGVAVCLCLAEDQSVVRCQHRVLVE